MKRILNALAAMLLLIPAAKHAEAGVDVSVDFLYNNLTDRQWVEVDDYGYCWQPSVTVSNTDWRPYTDGYWAYTDVDSPASEPAAAASLATPNVSSTGSAASATRPADERGKGRDKWAIAPAITPVPSTDPVTKLPGPTASPTTAGAEPKGKGKDTRSGKDPHQSIESAPLREMTPASAAPPVPRKDPNKGNHARETDPFTTDSALPPASGSEARPPTPPAENGPKNKDRRGAADIPAVQPSDAGVEPRTQPAPQENARGGGKPKKNEVKGGPGGALPAAAPQQGKGEPANGEKKDEGKGKPPKDKH